MKFNNKVSVCKITTPKGITQDLISSAYIPFSMQNTIDETHNTGTIMCLFEEVKQYSLDITKPFEPFSKVEIEFEGQSKKITMLLTADNMKIKRKGDFKTWEHTLNLIEETKLLERYKVDTLTFANPMKREFNKDALCYFSLYIDAHKMDMSVETLSPSKIILYQNECMKSIQFYNSSNTSILICDNLKSFGEVSNSNNFPYKTKKLRNFKLYVTTPLGQKNILFDYNENQLDAFIENGQYINHYASVTQLQGEYLLEVEFTFYVYEKTSQSSPIVKNDIYETRGGTIFYISSKETDNEIDTVISNQYSITDTVNRLLAVTPLRVGNDEQVFTFDEAQAEYYSTIESPEFSFTGHTLFEALIMIASYDGCFPELHGNVVRFRPLCNDTVITSSDLPEPYTIEKNRNMGQYCTHLDCDVQNLVCVTNNNVGSVVEPYRDGYKTLRAESGSKITEDNAVIKTSYPIYKSIDVEVGRLKGDNVDSVGAVGSIAPYLYESGEYNGLSDSVSNYPFSKAYAVKWEQMQKDYKELAHRIKTSSMDELNALNRPSLANIIYQCSNGQADISLDLLDYVLNLFNGKDARGTFYTNVPTRATYIPLINARLKQYKDYCGDFGCESAILYNQTAELVDSEMLGQNLKCVIAKMGNGTWAGLYKFKKYEDIPELGTIYVDDDGTEYTIYGAHSEIKETSILTTLTFVKYAELSQYIGVVNKWKDSDVSTTSCYERYVNYDEFIELSKDEYDDNNSNLTKKGMSYIFNYNYPLPITCAVATGKVVNGDVDTELNTVALPVVSGATGNSVFFTFRNENNFSAGKMSEKAPDGATSSLSGTQFDRAQKDVKYGDLYGRLDKYSFAFYYRGMSASNDMLKEWYVDGVLKDVRFGVENREQNIIDIDEHIAHTLPLIEKENYEIIKNSTKFYEDKLFEVNDEIVLKNGNEALIQTAQFHFITDDESFVIGSGLSNFCSLVGANSNAFPNTNGVNVRVYGFPFKLNKFKRRLTAKEIENGTLYNELHFNSVSINPTNKKTVCFNVFGNNVENKEFAENIKSWAFVGIDNNGNYQIIFGQNKPINKQLSKTVYFNFRRKIK